MVYLDTGCLIKLYYPEPDSDLVATRSSGQAIVYTLLHALELTTAFELKVLRICLPDGDLFADVAMN